MPKELEKYLYIGGAALVGLIIIILLIVLISILIKNSKKKKSVAKNKTEKNIPQGNNANNFDGAITEKISTQKLLKQDDETVILNKKEDSDSSGETTILFCIEKEITYIHTNEIIKENI